MCIVCGIILLGYGVWRTDIEHDDSEARPILYIVDTSLSMSVDDIVWDDGIRHSRLDTVIDLLQQLPSNRPRWLMTFASSARLQIPFSLDDSLWDSVVSAITVIRYGAPTDIETALASAVLIYQDTPMDIVVLTDAESTVDAESQTWVTLSPGMSLHLIGIGTPEGGKIVANYDGDGRIVYKQYQWKDIISRLDENMLKSLSKKYDATTTIIGKYSDIETVIRETIDTLWSQPIDDKTSFVMLFGVFFIITGLIFPDYRRK